MTEYIERNALLDDISAAVKHRGMGEIIGQTLMRYVKRQPAADVAPVVRCKDCVHWDDDPDTYGADYGPKGKCMKSFETMCADDFCSYGERKDGES